MGLAIAVSVSGLLQLLWLYWFMRRAGFRIPRTTPQVTNRVKEMGVLIVPAVFGAGVYQISRFIDLAFIRVLPDGSLTYMAMADRWNQLPLGIIGIALGTAILPALSRHISKAEDEEAVRLQANAIELAMLLTLPCAVALFFTGFAFVKAFMQGQAFTAEDARDHRHGHIRAGGGPARLCAGQGADPQFLRPRRTLAPRSTPLQLRWW